MRHWLSSHSEGKPASLGSPALPSLTLPPPWNLDLLCHLPAGAALPLHALSPFSAFLQSHLLSEAFYDPMLIFILHFKFYLLLNGMYDTWISLMHFKSKSCIFHVSSVSPTDRLFLKYNHTNSINTTELIIDFSPK